MAEGNVIWHELATSDPESAKSFYEELFGWSVRTENMPNGPYHVFQKDGDHAGMMAMPPGAEGMPPTWTIYFHVEDVDAACAKVKALGGEVPMDPIEVENVGRFAIVTDPQGASFAIMTPVSMG